MCLGNSAGARQISTPRQGKVINSSVNPEQLLNLYSSQMIPGIRTLEIFGEQAFPSVSQAAN